MTEQPPITPELSHPTSQEVITLAMHLDEVMAEQAEDGAVDQLLVAYGACIAEAKLEFEHLQAKLDKAYEEKRQIEASIAHICDQLGDEDGDMGGQPEALGETRDMILTNNLKVQRATKRELTAKIGRWAHKQEKCAEYIANYELFTQQLGGRGEAVKRILGHLAMARQLASQLPAVDAQPLPFKDHYNQQTTHPDVDIRAFTESVDGVKKESLSFIPVPLPAPPPPDMPPIPETPLATLSLRPIPIPNGARRLFTK